MDKLKIEFRLARADDVEQAIPLVYSAGPEAFDYVFAQGQSSALDYLRYAFPDGAGFFGHRNHVAAILDNRVVGIGAFYSGVEYNGLSLGTMKTVLGFYGLRSPPVLLRATQTQKWMPAPRKNTQYVSNLGVAADMRGKGIGEALLRHQMQVAREKGKRIYALDVADINPRAQKLYESLGLVVIKETPFNRSRFGVRVPTARRMQLAL